MTFTNLEKYLYSKKYLKQRRQPPPPPPPLPPAIKVEGIFALRESLGYGCYLQLNFAYPADRVRKLSVICNLKGYFRQPGNRKTILKVPSF